MPPETTSSIPRRKQDKKKKSAASSPSKPIGPEVPEVPPKQNDKNAIPDNVMTFVKEHIGGGTNKESAITQLIQAVLSSDTQSLNIVKKLTGPSGLPSFSSATYAKTVGRFGMDPTWTGDAFRDGYWDLGLRIPRVYLPREVRSGILKAGHKAIYLLGKPHNQSNEYAKDNFLSVVRIIYDIRDKIHCFIEYAVFLVAPRNRPSIPGPFDR